MIEKMEKVYQQFKEDWYSDKKEFSIICGGWRQDLIDYIEHEETEESFVEIKYCIMRGTSGHYYKTRIPINDPIVKKLGIKDGDNYTGREE
jgi:hypothetical protein